MYADWIRTEEDSTRTKNEGPTFEQAAARMTHCCIDNSARCLSIDNKIPIQDTVLERTISKKAMPLRVKLIQFYVKNRNGKPARASSQSGHRSTNGKKPSLRISIDVFEDRFAIVEAFGCVARVPERDSWDTRSRSATREPEPRSGARVLRAIGYRSMYLPISLPRKLFHDVPSLHALQGPPQNGRRSPRLLDYNNLLLQTLT